MCLSLWPKFVSHCTVINNCHTKSGSVSHELQWAAVLWLSYVRDYWPTAPTRHMARRRMTQNMTSVFSFRSSLLRLYLAPLLCSIDLVSWPWGLDHKVWKKLVFDKKNKRVNFLSTRKLLLSVVGIMSWSIWIQDLSVSQRVLTPNTQQAEGQSSEAAETMEPVPAYTTKPMAWSVFLTVQPRSSRLSIPAPVLSLLGFSLQQGKGRYLLYNFRSCYTFITANISLISCLIYVSFTTIQ